MGGSRGAALGYLSRKEGDLKSARQHYEEALRMKQAVYSDKPRPAVAATLHGLGIVRVEEGDLRGGRQYQEEAERRSKEARV